MGTLRRHKAAQTSRQRASGHLLRAIGRLELDHPFHAALLMRISRRPDVHVVGIALSIQGQRVSLLYEPVFTLAHSLDELGVLLLRRISRLLKDIPAHELEGIGNTPDDDAEPDNSNLDREGVSSDGSDGPAGTVRQLLRESAAALGHIVPEKVRTALEHLGISVSRDCDSCEIDGNAKNAIPWSVVLRRYIGSQRLVRTSIRYPSRRMPGTVGVIAGRRMERRHHTVLACIDTSCSITPEMLNQIGNELRRLSRTSRVIVVECDTEIRRVYRFRELKEVSGRGGTDLRPPFAPAFINKHRPDVIVYFTDGEGPAPCRPPKIPVIWCLTAHGDIPATWGRVLRMDDK